MSITLKPNCEYDLVIPTSMGVRITPTDFQPVHTSKNYMMQVTSAESNVGSISASLGRKVKVLTTFVKDSPIARLIKDDLASRHIDYEGKDVEQGGPWGYRHQFNIADAGWGAWCTETGWIQGWILTVLALRQMNTSLWDLTVTSQVGRHLDSLRETFER